MTPPYKVVHPPTTSEQLDEFYRQRGMVRGSREVQDGDKPKRVTNDRDRH